MADNKPGIPTVTIVVMSFFITVIAGPSLIDNPGGFVGYLAGVLALLVGIRFTYLKIKQALAD